MGMGFVDLRLNHTSNVGGDSFWPSFTDIMTVVVMIFLLASTVLILNNLELVENLRRSILAQQKAAEAARTTSAEKQTVEEQLAQAQHELSVLRIELLQASEADKLKSQLLTEKERQLEETREDAEEMRVLLQSTEREAEKLQSQLREKESRLSSQESELQQTRQELTDLSSIVEQQNEELAILRKETKTLAALNAEARQYKDSLTSLQEDYDVLKVKYDKLFQPARSPSGKRVVTVRYEKSGSGYQIGYKFDEQDEFESLSRPALDQRLASLSEQYPNSLYVKIVIPEDSGLSYNEAWSFTREILDQYDYYYQK